MAASAAAVAAPDSLKAPETDPNAATRAQQLAALVAAKPWYCADPGARLSKPSVVDFYRGYVKLEGSALLDHLRAISEIDNFPFLKHGRAWPLGEYPCVGQWQWLRSTIPTLKSYPAAVDRLRDGEAVLDLGCCLGQDLRRLAADGAPTTNMYASDLQGELWELGYDLFRDRETMKAHFIQANILDESSHLNELKGKIDIFIICKFLHLFSWEDQIVICKKIVSMSRPGAMILGYQLGHRDFFSQKTPWGTMCFQTAQTFIEMWAQVSKETDTLWEVEVQELDQSHWEEEPEDYVRMGPKITALNFTVTRSDKSKL